MTRPTAFDRELDERIRHAVEYAVEPLREEITQLRRELAELAAFVTDPLAATCERVQVTAKRGGLEYWEPASGVLGDGPSEPFDTGTSAPYMRWKRETRVVLLSFDVRALLCFYTIDLTTGVVSKCPARMAPLYDLWRWLAQGTPIPVAAPDDAEGEFG